MPAGLIATTLLKPPISNASRAASVSWRQDKAAYREASPLEQTQKTVLPRKVHRANRHYDIADRAAPLKKPPHPVPVPRGDKSIVQPVVPHLHRRAIPGERSSPGAGRLPARSHLPSCQLRTSVTIWLPSDA